MLQSWSLITLPRVVGIDDRAWRRGRRYGTIVCDLERERVIDLLPDRSAEAVAFWLRQHPSVEVVACDRAGACVEGARQGAPEAKQVAAIEGFKQVTGDGFRSRTDRRRAIKGDVAVQALNRMLALGRPISVRVA